jgi:predicted nucleic acid-binding protein
MDALIESSVWVNYFHPKTPRTVRETARTAITQPNAVLGEPVIFELLRGAPKVQRPVIEAHFATMPVLSTPSSLWKDAERLGRACHDRGWVMGALDLLIASLCIHHNAELLSFDTQFADLAKVCPLKFRLLIRSTAESLP